MTEHEFELRLLAAARALDAEAPAFDPSVLPTRPSRIRFAVVALAIAAALAAVAAAPAAVSALRDLFEVESVPELGPVAADVAPAFLGRPASPDEARAAVPFQVRTIPALGAPDGAYVRDDIVGEMVTLAFENGTVVLTQWRATDVRARISIVPVQGTAEDVEIGSRDGLWTAGDGPRDADARRRRPRRPPRALRRRPGRPALAGGRGDVPAPGGGIEGERGPAGRADALAVWRLRVALQSLVREDGTRRRGVERRLRVAGQRAHDLGGGRVDGEPVRLAGPEVEVLCVAALACRRPPRRGRMVDVRVGDRAPRRARPGSGCGALARAVR